MRSFISVRRACQIILVINGAAVLMHLLILLRILPHDFVWGGRLEGDSEFIVFEALSILVLAVFMTVVAARAGYILKDRFSRTVRIAIWVLFALMVLNTLGNLASSSGLEMWLMTPLTGLSALLLLRVAIEKEKDV
ncbi:hypothetical protein [Paenibacillus koleovorans]|uniref:hypothetical protein n=1 Tax=Paenibacillus koleovorans TaxID=121608 RepID=UPI000FD93E1D|nr:hypothetical protein [Paenibacillus koleovorans]